MTAIAKIRWAWCWLLMGLAGTQPTLAQLSGRVVDEDGNAVPDASVVLVAAGVQTDDHFSARSDAAGCFVLNPPEPIKSRQYSVIAWKPGFAVGHIPHRISNISSEDGAIPRATDLDVVLAAAHPVTFAVVDPTGKPLPNLGVYARSVFLPDGEIVFYSGRQQGVDCLQRKTDDDGKVTIDYVPAGTTGVITIMTPEHGVQTANFMAEKLGEGAQLRLQPSSEITITLSANDRTPVSNREVVVETSIPRDGAERAPSQPQVAYGKATLTTDSHGVARGRVLSGTARVSMLSTPHDTSFPGPIHDSSMELIPGEAKKLDLHFEAGVRVFGRVVDSEGRPVPGVHIKIVQHSLVTDERGQYETYVPTAQQAFYRIISVPTGYVMPFEESGACVPPDAGEEHETERREAEQADIVVELASRLSGTVIDEQGHPVTGAQVNAAWQATGPSGRMFTRRSDQTTTDNAGRFQLDHVLRDVDILLNAQTDELASAQTTLHTEGDQSVELKVTAGGMLNIVGKVMGADGQPVANPRIKVTRAMRVADGNNYGNQLVRLNGRDFFHGDESGKFVTPQKLPRIGHYALQISVPGFVGKQTRFLQAGKDGDLNLGEIRLVRARQLQGTVLDSVGNPIQGAAVTAYSAEKVSDYVLKRLTTNTDPRGTFGLDNLHPNSALAVVEKEGYRPSGALLLAEASPQVTMYRENENVAEPDRIRIARWDGKARHAAAKRLVEGILANRRNSNHFHAEILDMLYRIDPNLALDELPHTKSAATRVTVLKRLGEYTEALAEASNISGAFSRCWARIEVARACPEEDVWRDALSVALVEAEQIQRPDRRLSAITAVADEFYAKGDPQQAETIIMNQRSQAQALPTTEWLGYARGSLATSLAYFDLAAGLQLIREMADDEQPRYLQNVAHRLAEFDPRAAEKVLREMKNSRYVDSPVVRVAYRMAKTDLPRAQSLVELIDSRRRPIAKPRALGAMAMAIRETSTEEARNLLRQAFEAVPTRSQSQADDDFGTAMTLLRYAEQVDPEHLTDYFWETAKRYGGPLGYAWSPEEAEVKSVDRQSHLVMLLALYDPSDDLVQRVAEPVFDYWEQRTNSDPSSSQFTDHAVAFMAMALADPPRAATWALEFEQALDEGHRRYIPQPWEVVGRTLTQDRDAIGRRYTRDVLHRWVIDQYDL